MSKRRMAEAFKASLLSKCHRSMAEVPYAPTRMYATLRRMTGPDVVAFIEWLINDPREPKGFRRMVQAKRLDLTAEAEVRDQPQWHGLFDPKTIRKANRRLRAYGY